MNKPIISAIAVIGKNRELGKENKLLWNFPEDMRHFKEITSGHPVIMGRKTYESIGKPLPNRTNIVITRQEDYNALECIVVDSVEEAIVQAKKYDQEEIFIIGGGQIYEQALPFVSKLYLTVVDDSKEADAYFPDFSEFKIASRESVENNSGIRASFCTYKR